MHCSYEKAGLTLPHLPIPWNAEAVLVEAILRLPPDCRDKNEFQLRLPGCAPIVPESMRKIEATGRAHDPTVGRFRLHFRLPTPDRTTMAELHWQEHRLGQVELPILTEADFLANLQLQTPTVFVRLGEQCVAAQAFVSTQCRGLYAGAHLRSTTHLAPLADLGLHVEFHSGTTLVEDVNVPLCATQLTAKEAMVIATPRRYPRKIGVWRMVWKLGERVLHTQEVRVISLKSFHESLRISDTRFVVQQGERLELHRQAPNLEMADRVGPAFVLSSNQPGMAALCDLCIHALVPGAIASPVLLNREQLVTDGPTLFAPGTLSASDLEQITGFELRLKDRVLTTVSLHPVPRATLNSEGGFKPAPTFAWSSIADDELSERLMRLIGG